MRRAKKVMKSIGNNIGGSSNTFISYNTIYLLAAHTNFLQ